MRRWLILCVATPLLIATAEARQFVIAGVAFSEAEIVDARGIPELDGRASIMVTLADAATTKLAEGAAKLGDSNATVSLDGTVLAEAPASAIAGPVITIGGRPNIADAEAIALRISGKPPISDPLEEEP